MDFVTGEFQIGSRTETQICPSKPFLWQARCAFRLLGQGNLGSV